MDETTNNRSSIGNEKVTNVRGRSRTLRGGHDPSNLGRLSGKARREKARQREADAELDRLTLRARLAVKGAQHLDAKTLDDVFSTLVSRAVGDGHVANGAAKLLLDMARAAVESDVTDPDTKPLEEMSAEERIALYTALLRDESDGDEGDDPALPVPLEQRESPSGQAAGRPL
jgi:hypothetical protein